MLCYLIHDYLPAFGETLAIELGVAYLLGFREKHQLLAVTLVDATLVLLLVLANGAVPPLIA